MHRYATDLQTEKFREIVARDFPNLREISAKSALCFVNNDEFFDLARPILHKIIYVGGLGIPLGSSPLPEVTAVILSLFSFLSSCVFPTIL